MLVRNEGKSMVSAKITRRVTCNSTFTFLLSERAAAQAHRL